MRKMLLSVCVALAVLGCGGDDDDLPPCIYPRCIDVYSRCGDWAYDASTEFCSYSDNTVYTKCGEKSYDPSTQFCSGSTVYRKCGGNDYNPSTEFCSGSTVYRKCSGNDYNPSTQYCSNGTVKAYYGVFSDSRDGKAYKITVIGTQTWFAENLNYNALGSKCYDNSDANCDTYGRLYDWATAMGFASSCNSNNSCWSQIQSPHQGICPVGWHVPRDDDWKVLMDYADSSVAGTKLRMAEWGGGTDDYGFSALPGGYGSSDGRFSSGGFWWNVTAENYASNAYYWNLNSGYSSYVMRMADGSKSNLYSVRCVQDYEKHIGKGNNISNYRTVKIGDQTWMAENLDYVVEGSKCYNNNPARCNAYGSLYDWATAMALPSSCNSNSCWSQVQSPHRGICPSGWHIPRDGEWDELVTAVGGSSTAGTKLKATNGWNSYNGVSGNGTDEYGFSALPGGIDVDFDADFDDAVGYSVIWWSATESYDAFGTYFRFMRYDFSGVGRNDKYKSYLFSVRCVQDGEEKSSSSAMPSSSSITLSSSSSAPLSSSSIAPSSSSSVPTFTCTMTATTGTVGVAITPAPTVTCNGSMVIAGLAWTPANLTPTAAGSVSVSVSANFDVCSGRVAQCGSVAVSASFTYGSLSYEGQSYKTIKIGTQTWMAENLNYNVSGSRCYGDNTGGDSQNRCGTYGRLYNWSTAMGFDASCNSNSCSSQIQSPHQGICPAGWHLPSDAEWDVLMTAVGGANTAGTKLKAKSGWNDYQGASGNGTDEYGFSALPGGDGYSDGSFSNVGSNGDWWSATEHSASVAYGRNLYYDFSNVNSYVFNKSYLWSVRCLQD